jgi:hypothetical protein
MATVVHRYGTPARAAKDAPARVMEQHQLGHQLRNTLVEIHHRYEEAVAAAWAARPEVARAEEDVEQATTALDEVRERMNAKREADRTTKPRPESKAALTAARTALADAKTQRKAVRGDAYPAVKEAIVDAKTAEQAAVKATYADFVQTRGLYIVDHHRTATKRIAAARRQGKPAQLRFSRWDGTGHHHCATSTEGRRPAPHTRSCRQRAAVSGATSPGSSRGSTRPSSLSSAAANNAAPDADKLSCAPAPRTSVSRSRCTACCPPMPTSPS